MAYLGPDSSIPTKGKGSKLSTKQSNFVKEYMVDFNASQAVLRAGYLTNNPNRLGVEMMRHPLILRELKVLMDKRDEKIDVTKEYVIQKLMKIVQSTEEDNPSAALRGLELLGKHLGLYRDRTEISGPDGHAIEMEQRVKEDVTDFKSKLDRLAESGGAQRDVVVPIGRGASKA